MGMGNEGLGVGIEHYRVIYNVSNTGPILVSLCLL